MWGDTAKRMCWGGGFSPWVPRATPPCPCRSFENNWNIYKLLAHQKPAQEKVRRDEEQAGDTVPTLGTRSELLPPCPCPRRAPSAWPS